MTKEKRLTESQLKAWRIASNRVSLESLRYAADICGYTPLTTETITTLETLITGRASSADCRVLYQQALNATLRSEPLIHPIRIALDWASSDGSGEFLVGNIVDPIYSAKWDAGEPNPDAETNKKLEEIRHNILGPYFRQLHSKAPKVLSAESTDGEFGSAILAIKLDAPSTIDFVRKNHPTSFWVIDQDGNEFPISTRIFYEWLSEK
jgi:hypothetical protein